MSNVNTALDDVWLRSTETGISAAPMGSCRPETNTIITVSLSISEVSRALMLPTCLLAHLSVCVHVCVCVSVFLSVSLSGKCIVAKRLIGSGCRFGVG